MKKLICMILATILALSGSMSYKVYADEEKSMSLDDMLGILLTDGSEYENIELDAQLLQVQYNERIEDYEDLKEDTVDRAKDALDSHWASLEAQMEKYGKQNTEALTEYASAIIGNYLSAKSTFRQVLEQYVSAMKSLEPVLLQIQQVERKKQAEIEKVKYDFIKQYYDLYLAERNLGFNKQDLDLLNKRIDVEKVKLDQGLTTKLDMDELESQKDDLIVSILDGENNIELLKEKIKNQLNIDPDKELKVAYALPSVKNVVNYGLKTTMTAFANKNIDLEKVNKNEEIAKEAERSYKLAYTPNPEIEAWSPKMTDEQEYAIKTAEIQYKQAQNTTKNTKRDMDLYVIKTYYNYKKAAANLKNNENVESLYEQEKAILNMKLAQGQISQVQYNSDILINEKSLITAEKARIDFYLARLQMELTEKGIQIQ